MAKVKSTVASKGLDMDGITDGAKGLLAVIKELSTVMDGLVSSSNKVAKTMGGFRGAGGKQTTAGGAGGQLSLGQGTSNFLSNSLAKVTTDSGKFTAATKIGKSVVVNESMNAEGYMQSSMRGWTNEDSKTMKLANFTMGFSTMRNPTDMGEMLSNFNQGVSTMMPSIANTMTRATSYYNATLYNGNRLPRATSGMQAIFGQPSVQDMTFKTLASSGGLTSVGSDANVAKYLTGRGMSVSGADDSTYQQTLRTVGNAGKYLNISNEAAAASIEHLTSGQGSSAMLRKMGIYTSDLSTGKEKTQSEIFDELAQRLTAGRPEATMEQTMASVRRGNLGQSIQGMFGNDQAGAEMFKQYMIERSGGTKMDLSSNASMKKIYDANGEGNFFAAGGATGNVNPLNAQMTMNTSDTAQLDKAEQAYVSGIQAAVGPLQLLNEAAGTLAQTFAGMPTAMAAMMGNNNVVKGGMQAGGSLLQFTAANALEIGKLAGSMNWGGAIAQGANLGVGLGIVAAEVAGGAAVTAIGGGLSPSNQSDMTNQRKAQGGGSSRPQGGQTSGGALESPSMAIGKKTATPTTAYGATYDFDPNGPAHMAIDYGVGKNTPIYSLTSGSVSRTGGNSKHYYPGSAADAKKDGYPAADANHGYLSTDGEADGIWVDISTEGGYIFRYAHLTRVASNISPGKTVSKGQIIGYSGDTGLTTGPHLHLQVSKNGRNVDPARALREINRANKKANQKDGGATTGAAAPTGAAVSAANDAAVAGAASANAVLASSSASTAGVASIMAALQSGNPAQMQAAVAAMTQMLTNQTTSNPNYTATGANAAVTSSGKGGSTSGAGGNNVTINLTAQNSSEEEAKKFATYVKQYLEDDTLTSNMGVY